jgi:peptidoglycan/xylan/chitin deacetylase (PgdA/CDA1 family)
LRTQTSEPFLARGLAVGAACSVAGALAAAVSARPRGGAVIATAGLSLVALTGAWIGANSPHAGWFGALVSHGPRTSGEVALTFDDGPNATATLAVAHVLEAQGAEGTFFLVGKAVVRRPDIARALVRGHHLVADHSYHHDELRWLDPRYTELAATQHAIAAATGRCPAFFRPPHGRHTPLMALVVHRRHMTMTTWDVSVGDWATDDPRAVARRVLRKVRAGSVVDLHDGLDGDVTTDRASLAPAVSLILDGLRARHLRPVRLDELLGRPGYLVTDRC